jgi:hypothetical protein
MLALPMVAAALLAARGGVRQTPLLLAIALAVSGATAFGGFWAYYASHTLGLAVSLLVPTASVLLIGLALWGWRPDRELVRGVATPLALWALATAFLVFFGFMHGGTGKPLEVAGTRFAPGITTDNFIPNFYTEWFYANGHQSPAMIFEPDWLSSDRPPLQIGYTLVLRPWFWSSDGLSSQLIGVALQQLWVVGLWALLTAAKVRRRTMGLALLAVLFSDVAIVNGFFVWPKLLPAGLLLACAALVLTPLWEQTRRDWRLALVVGALAALAMLTHGASVFGIIPLALVALWRGVPSWRWIGAGVAVGILLLAPWSAYQKWGEPPGNRLNIWFLAGEEKVADEGTLDAIRNAYGDVGFGGFLHDKAQNAITLVGGGPAVDVAKGGVEAAEMGEPAGAVNAARLILFFYFLPAMGLLLVTPLVMALRRHRVRDRDEWRFALSAYAVVAIGILAWVLILFGNDVSRTDLHQGSYLLPILGLAAGAVGLRAVAPRFACWYVPIAALLMLSLYVPSVTPEPGTSYAPLAIALAALFAGGFCWLAFQPRLRPYWRS